MCHVPVSLSKNLNQENWAFGTAEVRNLIQTVVLNHYYNPVSFRTDILRPKTVLCYLHFAER